MVFPCLPHVKQIPELCEISERLGCLKVEVAGITKFFSQAAKTYCYQTENGDIAIKAKGFSLMDKLLKDNGEVDILEKNMSQMFSGFSDTLKANSASFKIYQKQIAVNPQQMVPALKPKMQSFKNLNFIGPRRQIDLDSWVNFKFERVPIDLSKTVDVLKNYEEYPCTKKKSTPVKLSQDSCEKYEVILKPEFQGILPAIPFGMNLETCLTKLKFYQLAPFKK